MTNKEAIEWIKYHINTTYYEETDDLLEAFEKAIKALEQEPCNDAISRQIAIDEITKIHPVDTEYDSTLYDKIDVMYVLKNLPSVIPQQKTGHWIETRYVGNDKYNFECSVCHCTDTHSKFIKVKHVKYCWNCGARMEVQENETDN